MDGKIGMGINGVEKKSGWSAVLHWRRRGQVSVLHESRQESE